MFGIVFQPPAPSDPQPSPPRLAVGESASFATRKPLTFFGLPIRVDATLCAPGEIWIERPDGEAVLVWPR